MGFSDANNSNGGNGSRIRGRLAGSDARSGSDLGRSTDLNALVKELSRAV